MTETHPAHATQHRAPDMVMRLARLGSLHQCRLSFMRQLTRRMAQEAWSFSRPEFEINSAGVGHAVYQVDTGTRQYALVAFAHDLPPEKRTDRVIAEAWDATFALFDGQPSAEDVARLRRNVPKQEAGRVSGRELTLSRANRSVRLWSQVVDALAAGQQPPKAALEDVGYLMRTTAVYGSGKFGAADRDTIKERSEMTAPFQAEMLTVYLIRTFVRDLLNHQARQAGGAKAVSLDEGLATLLGIGNSTGLGMAPFLVNHPVLLNNWILAREEAIARVRDVRHVTPEAWDMVMRLASQSLRTAQKATSTHPIQIEKTQALIADLETVLTKMRAGLETLRAWDGLAHWASSTLSYEGQECLLSLMLEPYPKLVDGLSHCMDDHLDARFRIDGLKSIEDTEIMLRSTFGWALETDWTKPEAKARAWYVSAEKLEPRLGERAEEPIAPYEQPLCTGLAAAEALQDMLVWLPEASVASFLLQHPEHRDIVRRAQIAQFAPYSEIRDNLLSAYMLPIDMLRAKLSFFGATEFDPRSDRWVRIKMFAGAPYPEALAPDTADHWVYPEPLA